ncbi:MAG: hypothetical protein K2P78_14630 [Gemmataceae bacterium]|nr:hypothetical protein [Gemmataceae bacterium]
MRSNFGSHRRVMKVFAYDPAARTASVVFDGGDIATVSLSELEALEPDGNTYADLGAALRHVAHEIVGE